MLQLELWPPKHLCLCDSPARFSWFPQPFCRSIVPLSWYLRVSWMEFPPMHQAKWPLASAIPNSHCEWRVFLIGWHGSNEFTANRSYRAFSGFFGAFGLSTESKRCRNSSGDVCCSFEIFCAYLSKYGFFFFISSMACSARNWADIMKFRLQALCKLIATNFALWRRALAITQLSQNLSNKCKDEIAYWVINRKRHATIPTSLSSAVQTSNRSKCHIRYT